MLSSLFLRRRCCGGSLWFRNGWRSFATRRDLVQPWLMLSSPTNPETRYFFDVFSDGTLELNREIHLPQISSSVCIGSSEGFLFTIPTRGSPDAIHAVNPLNPKEDRFLLPSTTTLRSAEYCLNRSFFGVNVRRWKRSDGEVVVLDQGYFSLYVSKIVLSPSLDVAVLLRNGKADYARLSLASSSSWTPIETHEAPPTASDLGIFNDCIFHDGRLHVCNHAGSLAIVDLDDPSIPPLSSSSEDDAPRTLNQGKFYIPFRRSPFRRSLVESPDGKDLFLLKRFKLSIKTFRFEVFKLGNNNKWNQVGSIGDLVFFVGPNTSVAMSALDFPNLQPNSIYFTDYYIQDLFLLNSENVGDTGIFSLDDGSVQFFNLTHGHEELNWPRPVWFMPLHN